MELKDPKNGRPSKVRSLVNRYIHHHRIRIKARNNHDLDTYRIHHDKIEEIWDEVNNKSKIHQKWGSING
jgi:predicted SnoaL-like aldol condensation-catalyzing enzyme